MSKVLDRPLPIERIATATGSEIALTLVGLLLVVLCANGLCLAYLRRYSPNPASYLVRDKWRRLQEAPDNVDWLVLGDSSGNQGVVPKILEAHLGGKALNLCTVAALAAVGDLWMLEAWIARHGPPKNLIIVHTFDIWPMSKPDPAAMAKTPLPYRWWCKAGSAVRLSLTREEEATFFLSRYVPIYADNLSIMNRLRRPWALFETSADIGSAGFMRTLRADPVRVRAEGAMYQKHARVHPFHISAMNKAALKAIRSLAHKHAFPIYMAHGPVWEGMAQDVDFATYLELCGGQLRGFADSAEGIRYIGTKPETFPEEAMTDPRHVTEVGARRYTTHLAEAILAARTGPGR